MSTETEMTSDSLPIPPDLGDEAVRRRLGPAGWKAFSRIMRIWQAPEQTSRRLIGLAPKLTWTA